MPRKRFTQIIDKTNNVIPVGGEAQNITLKDGSVLEEALGKINLAENGSIMDQLNKLKTDTLTKDYAPLMSPYIQQNFQVQQDYISKNIDHSIETMTNLGLTLTKKNSNVNTWSLSGTCQTSKAGLLCIIGRAGGDPKVGENGTYFYKIKTDCLVSNKIFFQFYYCSNTSTQNNYVDGHDILIKAEDIPSETNEIAGTFTVPSGSKITRAGLLITAEANGTVISDKNLEVYLFKNKDATTLPFQINKISSNGTWQTQIADKLTVFPYKNGKPTSELGIIQGGSSSSWKGILKVDTEGESQNGILVRDSGIGFLLSTNNNNISKRQTGIISPTNHRIFAGYNSNKSDAIPGIYYDTSNQHNFRIKNSATWPVVFRLTLSGATFSNSIFVNNAATIKGKLTAQGETDLKTTTVTDLTVSSKFRSNDVPIQVNVTSMKILEEIINNPSYPVKQMLLLRLEENVVYYLVTGNKSKNSSAASCPAMGFKTSNNNIILFYAGQGKIYRTQYWWPTGQANGNNNRKWTTYSTTLGTDELIGKKPVGEKFL